MQLPLKQATRIAFACPETHSTLTPCGTVPQAANSRVPQRVTLKNIFRFSQNITLGGRTSHICINNKRIFCITYSSSLLAVVSFFPISGSRSPGNSYLVLHAVEAVWGGCQVAMAAGWFRWNASGKRKLNAKIPIAKSWLVHFFIFSNLTFIPSCPG